MSIAVSVASIVLALIGTAIAVLSYGRAMSGGLPSIDIVAEADAHNGINYNILIDNPSRRSIILEQLEILRPDSNEVAIQPENISRKGTLERSWE